MNSLLKLTRWETAHHDCRVTTVYGKLFSVELEHGSRTVRAAGNTPDHAIEAALAAWQKGDG